MVRGGPGPRGPPWIRPCHCPILLELETNEVEKGPGLWKFNNSLLEKEGFKDKLRIKVEELIQKYLTPAQNWENIKFEISQFAHEQAIARERKAKLLKCLDELAVLRDEQCFSLENTTDRQVELQESFNSYYEEKIRGTIFRSRARWYTEREKY